MSGRDSSTPLLLRVIPLFGGYPEVTLTCYAHTVGSVIEEYLQDHVVPTNANVKSTQFTIFINGKQVF